MADQPISERHQDQLVSILDSFGTSPLFIEESHLPAALESLSRLANDTRLSEFLRVDDDDGYWPTNEYSYMNRYKPYKVQDGILRVEVNGTLLNRVDRQYGMYATGYEYLRRALERGLDDPDVNGIAFVVDSPGGEAAGSFELADQIFESRGIKPIQAFVAENALSGGYLIASTGEAVHSQPSGRTGSVGVVRMHMDISGMLSDVGVKPSFIYAGKRKIDGHPFRPLGESARKNWQVEVDRLYDQFTAQVARNRNLDQDAVKATEAGTFNSDDSLEIGFIDQVDTLETGLAEFAASFQSVPRGLIMPQLTQADLDAAVATAISTTKTEMTTAMEAAVVKAKDDTKAEVLKGFTDRMSAVLVLEEFAGREKLALNLLATTTLSAEAIQATLKTSPKIEAPAPNKNGSGKNKGGRSHFTEAMNNEDNPNAGQDDNPDGEEVSLDDKVDGIFASAGYKRNKRDAA